MRSKCEQCGSRIKKNHKYCGECGALAPVVEVKPDKVKCSGCGSAISASLKFCNKCGVQLSGAEEAVIKGHQEKTLIRKIINISLLSLLIAIVVLIAFYISAGFLFKHKEFKLKNHNDIIEDIHKYVYMTYDKDEIALEIEEDAINAFILSANFEEIFDNKKIKIDDFYLESKDLVFYVNAKFSWMSLPVSFSLDIEDNDNEIKVKIKDLKYTSLKLPLPSWIANVLLRKRLVLSRDDGEIPKNIYFKNLKGTKRDITLTLEVDTEQIMRNVKKELDKADRNILSTMSESIEFLDAYKLLIDKDTEKDVTDAMLMQLISEGKMHAIYLPLGKAVLEEEMGSYVYEAFKMGNGLEYLIQKLNETE